MISDVVPGWQLLWFLALRRLTPVGMVLLTTGLLATVPGAEDVSPLPIAAIEVYAGSRLFPAPRSVA